MVEPASAALVPGAIVGPEAGSRMAVTLPAPVQLRWILRWSGSRTRRSWAMAAVAKQGKGDRKASARRISAHRLGGEVAPVSGFLAEVDLGAVSSAVDIGQHLPGPRRCARCGQEGGVAGDRSSPARRGAAHS